MKRFFSFICLVICLLFVHCDGALIKSNVGARHSQFDTEKQSWSNPYVTDGLIGMWDGEWNAGGGTHNNSTYTWVDISGNKRDAELSGNYAWGDNYWYVESFDGKGIAKWDAKNLGNNQTIEFVVKSLRHNGYGRFIAEGPSVASPCYMNDYYVYMYGYNLDTGVDIRSVISGFIQTDIHLHQIVHPSGGPLYYYIDGILVWTRTATGNSTGAEFGYFANRKDYTRGIDAYYFTIRMYNRILTENELVSNYLVDKERFGL